MKALLALVVAMGMLILAGLAVLGTLIAHRMSPANSAKATIALSEPAGTQLGGIQALGPDRLALQLHGGGDDRILVLDLRSGRPMTRIQLAPFGPRP